MGLRIHVHHYRVDAEVFDEFLRRREATIDAMRALHPALTRTVLVRMEDGGYSDTWVWESPEAQGAAWGSLENIPQAAEAMALTNGSTARSGDVVAVR